MEHYIKSKIKMKHIVNMACGLANRMFQYSYYLYLKDKGYNVEVDFYTSAKLSHEHVLWHDIFPKAQFSQASLQDVKHLGGANDVWSKIRRRFLPFLSKSLQMPTAFDALLPDKNKSTYIFGVFQNAKMVESIASQIKEVFTFADIEGDNNLHLIEKIRNEESVAIHVRKGADYCQRIWYQNTCPSDYYTKAIEEMRKRLKNPHFYVFADNKEWVKEHFTDFEYTLVEGNPVAGWGSHFDMQLMSLCKHNIISNSTYSWWGAFLNQNKNIIVICPKIWFNPNSTKVFESDRLLCKNWLTI